MPIGFSEVPSGEGAEFEASGLSLLSPIQPSEIIEVIAWCEDAFGPMLTPTGRGPANKSTTWHYTLGRTDSLVLQKGQLRVQLGKAPRYAFIVRVNQPALAQRFRDRWVSGHTV
jgi:hypothetical protein